MKTFKVSGLLQNLTQGLGSKIKLEKIPRKITIQIGPDNPGKMLSLLLVNQLPRLYYSNPDLNFEVSNGPESSLTVENNLIKKVGLNEKSEIVFNSLIKTIESV